MYDLSRTPSNSIIGSIFVVSMLLAGCGARREFRVSHLGITRASWDTVRVDVGFEVRTLLGGANRARPGQISVVAFSQLFDTLYAGFSDPVVLDDRNLGDEEPVLIEVCGVLNGAEACEQTSVSASPKRVTAVHDIEYPVGKGYARGRYSVRYTVERHAFMDDAWEVIAAPEGFDRYLLAYVDGGEGDAVRVPIRRASGTFDLSASDHYNDFRFYLQSKLLDESAARVRFDVYAGLRGREMRLASHDEVVRRKSRLAREADAGHFAEQAAERLMEALRAFAGSRPAFAYMSGWRFVEGGNQYDIDLQLAWEAGFFGGRWHEVAGSLSVEEDGSEPRFSVTGGNERGRRRWDERFGKSDVAMTDLLPPPREDNGGIP